MQRNNKKFNSGFTLMEVLLYVSIISVMVLAISAFFFLILQSRTKFQSILEVNEEGSQAIHTITQVVRNSENITVPSVSESGSILTLDMIDFGKNPTVFNSSGTNIQIKEGVGTVIPLTSSKVVVSNLVFENVSGSGTSRSLKVRFTLSHANPSLRNEYDYSKTFYASASLR